MFGKNPRLNALESRKQLLIVESELNRALLIQECGGVADGVRSLADGVATIRSMLSATASVMASLASFWSGKSGDAGAKPSWMDTILKRAGAVSNLWQAFRAPGHVEKNNGTPRREAL